MQIDIVIQKVQHNVYRQRFYMILKMYSESSIHEKLHLQTKYPEETHDALD